jgi:hypothetical protein
VGLPIVRAMNPKCGFHKSTDCWNKLHPLSPFRIGQSDPEGIFLSNKHLIWATLDLWLSCLDPFGLALSSSSCLLRVLVLDIFWYVPIWHGYCSY